MKVDKQFSNMSLKQLLSENVLGALPSSKLMKMKWNPVTDKKSQVKEAIISNNMRIHVSKVPMTLQKKKYTQEDGMKPNGFWYGFGKEWINWTKTEMPKWAGKYIYEVGVSGNILKISTFEKLLQFNKDFKTESGTGLSTINWKNVASKYNGIEIVPYQYKAKSNFTLLWYYGWDIGSGCIWNLGNTSLNLISK